MLTMFYASIGLLCGGSVLAETNKWRNLDWVDLITLMTWVVLWPFMFVAEVGCGVGEFLKHYEGE